MYVEDVDSHDFCTGEGLMACFFTLFGGLLRGGTQVWLAVTLGFNCDLGLIVLVDIDVGLIKPFTNRMMQQKTKL